MLHRGASGWSPSSFRATLLAQHHIDQEVKSCQRPDELQPGAVPKNSNPPGEAQPATVSRVSNQPDESPPATVSTGSNRPDELPPGTPPVDLKRVQGHGKYDWSDEVGSPRRSLPNTPS